MFLYSNLGGMGLIGHFDICGERESNILTSETSFYIYINVNKKDLQGNTPLHLGARKGHHILVKKLLLQQITAHLYMDHDIIGHYIVEQPKLAVFYSTCT